MSEEQRVHVSIYCKIFNDSFSAEMLDRRATGKEIYDFLMKDAGLSVDEKGDLISGDCNLWYLGCNAHYGCLKYKESLLCWDIGESSFAIVEGFISLIYVDKVFTKEQYLAVMAKSQEGRLFDNMYDIARYLKAKREGKPWVRTKDALEFRLRAKRFAIRVSNHLQNEGESFIDSGLLRW